MSLPFDLATSKTFNSHYIFQSISTPVKLILEMPKTAKHIRGPIYRVPGMPAKGFSLVYYKDEIRCFIGARFNAIDNKAFDEAIERVRKAVKFEMHQVAATYANKKFKRLVGLSQLHAYRANKQEAEGHIRECLNLADDEAVSFLTPTSAADTITKASVLKSLGTLPLPIAVIRNHEIDGHIYLQLKASPNSDMFYPVAVVSKITPKVLAGIRAMVSVRKSESKMSEAYWLERLDIISNVAKKLGELYEHAL
tara:strand:+ start:5739 stop:6494 length:756 start_codon:yes stop_codon:yes gene_type:complete